MTPHDEFVFELLRLRSCFASGWKWNQARARIEDGNGNEVFGVDIVDYLNLSFEEVPKLLADQYWEAQWERQVQVTQARIKERNEARADFAALLKDFDEVEADRNRLGNYTVRLGNEMEELKTRCEKQAKQIDYLRYCLDDALRHIGRFEKTKPDASPFVPVKPELLEKSDKPKSDFEITCWLLILAGLAGAFILYAAYLLLQQWNL